MYPTGGGFAVRRLSRILAAPTDITVNANDSHASTRPAVNHELFLMGHRNLPVTSIGHCLLATLTAWAAYGTSPQTTLAVWLIYMLAVGALYGALFWRFRSYANADVPDIHALSRWRNYRHATQLISGVGWGGIGFLLVPGAEVHNILLMTAYAGMIGYSGATNSFNDSRGFALSALALTVVMVSELATTFGAQATALSVMCTLYALVLTVVVKNAHMALRETIRLRIANQALAAENAASASKAEKANRDKSEFLAAASHDLRQPVHALLLLLEAYRQREPAALKHPLMRQISAAGQSINSMFNALMELSRLESGNERVSYETILLPDLMEAALDGVRPAADDKGLATRIRTSPQLRNACVRTDRVLLGRVLGNLLNNAVRYTHKGGILLSARPAHANAGIWLEVWDTGTGIEQVHQTRIFDPYVQLGNQERDRAKGLGLGLAIVRHATQLLGLPLSLHSRAGRGSCFRVLIPDALLSEAPPATTIPALLDEPTSAYGALTGRRVLLVDDDPMVLQAMQALLSTWNIDLRCLSAGISDASVSVLDACGDDWTPECIISDFRLPGNMDGIEILDLLLERFPTAIGVLQTGELAHHVQARAQDEGYLVLSKPVAPELLATTLNALLERRRTPR